MLRSALVQTCRYMYACQLFAIYGECLVSESQLFVEFSLLVFHASSPSLGPCSPSVWVGGPPVPLMSAHWTHTCSHTPTLYTWRDIYTVCKYINKQCTYVKRDDIKLLAATNFTGQLLKEGLSDFICTYMYPTLYGLWTEMISAVK